MRHTVTHCDTLRHAATLFNTLQHAATHYNTLQHTVIYRTRQEVESLYDQLQQNQNQVQRQQHELESNHTVIQTLQQQLAEIHDESHELKHEFALFRDNAQKLSNEAEDSIDTLHVSQSAASKQGHDLQLLLAPALSQTDDFPLITYHDPSGVFTAAELVLQATVTARCRAVRGAPPAETGLEGGQLMVNEMVLNETLPTSAFSSTEGVPLDLRVALTKMQQEVNLEKKRVSDLRHQLASRDSTLQDMKKHHKMLRNILHEREAELLSTHPSNAEIADSHELDTVKSQNVVLHQQCHIHLVQAEEFRRMIKDLGSQLKKAYSYFNAPQYQADDFPLVTHHDASRVFTSAEVVPQAKTSRAEAQDTYDLEQERCVIEDERQAVNVAIQNANNALKQQQDTITSLIHERDVARQQADLALTTLENHQQSPLKVTNALQQQQDYIHALLQEGEAAFLKSSMAAQTANEMKHMLAQQQIDLKELKQQQQQQQQKGSAHARALRASSPVPAMVPVSPVMRPFGVMAHENLPIVQIFRSPDKSAIAKGQTERVQESLERAKCAEESLQHLNYQHQLLLQQMTDLRNQKQTLADELQELFEKSTRSQRTTKAATDFSEEGPLLGEQRAATQNERHNQKAIQGNEKMRLELQEVNYERDSYARELHELQQRVQDLKDEKNEVVRNLILERESIEALLQAKRLQLLAAQDKLNASADYKALSDTKGQLANQRDKTAQLVAAYEVEKKHFHASLSMLQGQLESAQEYSNT